MAGLLRRSAAPALELLWLPCHLVAAGSGPALHRSISQYHPRDGSRGLDQLKTPVNWGVTVVPERNAFVVERFGKYLKTLTPGIHLLVPAIDKIAFVHSLKEQVFPISDQSALSGEGICLEISGTLFIVDPYLASYGVENPVSAVIQLAQTTMKRELGKMTLDRTFKEIDALNEKIVSLINEVAVDWGLECIRFEIRDISPPDVIKLAMEMEVEAELERRVQILESEAAAKSLVARAKAEAQATLAMSEASARCIRLISEALAANGGTQAANVMVAQECARALSDVANTGETTILQSDVVRNPASLVPQALKVYEIIQSNSKTGKGHPQQ